MSNVVNKWKTCPKFKANTLYGSITFLSGCVLFWMITKHKVAQYINNELKVFTPTELKKVAWMINAGFKVSAIVLWVKALYDYKKCS